MPENPLPTSFPILMESFSSFALPHLNLMKKGSASSQGQMLPYLFPSVMKLLLTSNLVFPPCFTQFQTIAPCCSPSCPTKKRFRVGKIHRTAAGGLGNTFYQQLHRDRKNPDPSPTYDLTSSKSQRLIDHGGWCETASSGSAAYSPAPTGRVRHGQSGLQHLLF